jgi:hypothetical protein
MNTERGLADTAIGQQLWAEAVDQLFAEDWEVRDQADHYSAAFADAVAAGSLSVDELREMANEANALEKAAIDKGGEDFAMLGNADYFEAMARRIANGTLNAAYQMVKNRERLQGYRLDYRRKDIVRGRTEGYTKTRYLL